MNAQPDFPARVRLYLNKIVFAAQRIENERRHLADGQPSPAWIQLNQHVDKVLEMCDENDHYGGDSGVR